jgi:nucleoside-diphosphate-sugar epimerase
MRVLVVGASGAIGRRLLPQLIDRGHEVVGTCRSAQKAGLISALGAEAVALDLLDTPAVDAVVRSTEPDAIVHQATALANGGLSRKLDKPFAQTNRLRSEGTDALLAAAAELGLRHFVAQSFAPYRYAREGGMVKTEDDPLDLHPPKGAERTNAAMAYLDRVVRDFGGIALRYGGLLRRL